MKPATPIPDARPSLVAALDDALAPDGAAALDGAVPRALWRRALVDPAAEFLARPGKELRAAIVRAGWALGGGDPGALPPRLPVAIEVLHAGSLIVDDIEDGADERRGGPALHLLVGVPLAINTGSWMYFWALAELAASAGPEAAQRAVPTLVRCHAGQALDLATRVDELEVTEVAPVVDAITRLKTGALCRLAIELGALAAGAPAATLAAAGAFGEQMGAVLQMFDDVGALTAPARRAKADEDLRHRRATWPWAWVAADQPFAWTRLAAALREPDARLEAIADELAGLVGATGRLRAREQLARAFTELTAALGASPAIAALEVELARMEASYV